MPLWDGTSWLQILHILRITTSNYRCYWIVVHRHVHILWYFVVPPVLLSPCHNYYLNITLSKTTIAETMAVEIGGIIPLKCSVNIFCLPFFFPQPIVCTTEIKKWCAQGGGSSKPRALHIWPKNFKANSCWLITMGLNYWLPLHRVYVAGCPVHQEPPLHVLDCIDSMKCHLGLFSCISQHLWS